MRDLLFPLIWSSPHSLSELNNSPQVYRIIICANRQSTLIITSDIEYILTCFGSLRRMWKMEVLRNKLVSRS